MGHRRARTRGGRSGRRDALSAAPNLLGCSGPVNDAIAML
jgi:hypothetical protein